MHLMKVDMGYSQFPDALVDAMGREKWEEMRAGLAGLELPAWDEVRANTPEEDEEAKREGGKKRYRYWNASGLITTEEAVRLTAMGVKLSVSRVRGLFSDRDPASVLADAQSGRVPGSVHIDISVPGGVALTSIRKVTWLEDACTQVLQNWLSDGWRIIAVCPPNYTRRPTYIIGHENAGAHTL